MYSVPFGKSPISGIPGYSTGARHCLGKLPNIQRDEEQQLGVGFLRSASCRRDDYASHLFIQQDILDKFFG